MPEFAVLTAAAITPPPNLKIYRLRPARVDLERVRLIGGRFGMRVHSDFGTISESAKEIAYTEGGWHLRVSRGSGQWKYRHPGRWQRDDGKSNLEIADANAFGLASEHLSKIGIAPERELPNQLRAWKVTRLYVAHAQRGGAQHEERVIDVGVAYQRIVDGLPVEGPGGKTIIYLDHQRQLTGIDHHWHEIEQEHEPVRGVRQVESAIEEVRRRYEGPGPGRVEVTEIRLGHFEAGWHDQQDWLQPAYAVFLRLVSQDERFRMKSVIVVPAAENSIGEIEGAPPPRVQQPPR
jgi:hypothetical protein